MMAIPLLAKKELLSPDVILGGINFRKIETLADQGQLTKKITAKAVDFINKNKDTPFFLYIHPMPHQPIAASEMFLGKVN